jgi:hypothetical protein
VSIDYQNLFGETVPEPTGGARQKRKPKPPQERARFAVGSVRYDRLDLVWVEGGKTHCMSVTAEQVRDWRQMEIQPIRFAAESPAEPSPATTRAPHVHGSATSEAAARKMDRKLAGKRLAVLEQVMKGIGFTNDDPRFTDNELVFHMVAVHEWSQNTARPRRIELTRDGWLEDSGERRNGSIVWRPTAKAWAWWNQHQNRGR